MTYGRTPASKKAAKAKHYQTEVFKTSRRVRKGEQKLHQGIDKSSTTFCNP